MAMIQNKKALLACFFLVFLAVFAFAQTASSGKDTVVQESATEPAIQTKINEYTSVAGTGKLFTLEQSAFPVSISSSETVSIRLRSSPKMIEYSLAPAAGAVIKTGKTIPKKTNIIISGLKPGKVYYKYEDSYRNLATVYSDSTGKYAYIQDLSKKHLVWVQESASNPYFISDDATGGDCEGKSIGIWDNDTKTCFLTKDLGDSVEIISDGISIRNGSLNGGGAGYGVIADYVSNILIFNFQIRNFVTGIEVSGSENATISYNRVFDNVVEGISLWDSSNSTVEENWVYSNPYGIVLAGSSGNSILNNTIYQNGYGIYLWIAANNNTLAWNTVYQNWEGILLDDTNGNNISSNSITNNSNGVVLSGGSGNKINGNNIQGNGYFSCGIVLREYAPGKSSRNNIIEWNNLVSNIVSNENNFCNNQPADANAENNWWGTVIQSEISQKIIDHSNNPSYGVADFIPWLIAPMGDTCVDGTLDKQCSVTKPLFCNNGNLTAKCQSCGCNIGYSCQPNGSCTINPAKCSDGTSIGSCSITKPLYCNSSAQLVNNCQLCSCPGDKTCQLDGNCTLQPKCADGTSINSCSATKPLYCDSNAHLSDNCQLCGCSSGTCQPSGSCGGTLPDLYIEWVKPIQVIEGADLVKGKATVVRVKVVRIPAGSDWLQTDVKLTVGTCILPKKIVLIKDFNIVDFFPPKECIK